MASIGAVAEEADAALAEQIEAVSVVIALELRRVARLGRSAGGADGLVGIPDIAVATRRAVVLAAFVDLPVAVVVASVAADLHAPGRDTPVVVVAVRAQAVRALAVPVTIAVRAPVGAAGPCRRPDLWAEQIVRHIGGDTTSVPSRALPAISPLRAVAALVLSAGARSASIDVAVTVALAPGLAATLAATLASSLITAFIRRLFLRAVAAAVRRPPHASAGPATAGAPSAASTSTSRRTRPEAAGRRQRRRQRQRQNDNQQMQLQSQHVIPGTHGVQHRSRRGSGRLAGSRPVG